MSIRIKNTANDRSKTHLHRVASKLVQEPSLLGRRLRLGDTMTISDEDYDRNKILIDDLVRKGVVEILGNVPKDKTPRNASGLRLDGPTLEEWKKAGYSPENYPPEGYAEKKSPGLTKYREEQELIAKSNYGRVNPETGASVMAERANKSTDPVRGIPADPIVLDEAQELLPPKAAVETQMPSSLGGDVVVTETVTPPEAIAEVLPPIAPPAVPAVVEPAPTEKKGPGKKKLI